MKGLAGKPFFARSIEMGLTFIAILLWILSISQARLNVGNFGDLGLVTILPLTYFVSFSILTTSFLITLISDKSARALLIVQIISLILFLHLTPALVEDTPRFRQTYLTYTAVDYVAKKGNIDPSFSAWLWYHNWPALSFIFSMFSLVTRFPAQRLLMAYPAVYQILLFPVLFLFFREVKCRDEKMWIAIWIFYMADWIGQNYFSLQSLGFFSYALILCLIVGKNIDKLREGKIRYLIILILLFVSLATTHLLSYLAVLTVLLGFFMLRYFRKTNLIAFAIVVQAFWTMFGSISYVEENLMKHVSQALNLQLIFQRNLGERIGGTAGQILVSQTRIVFTALVFLFAFTGLILAVRHREIGIIEKKLFFIVPSLMTLLPLFAYGGELLMRLYLFSLIPVAYFVSKNLLSRKSFISLSLFLILLAPSFSMVAHYGNEKMDYFSQSQLNGANFLFETTDRGYFIGFSVEGNFLHHSGYSFIFMGWTRWKDNVILPDLATRNQTLPVLLIISQRAIVWYDWFGHRSEYINSTLKELHVNLDYSPHYNKIYSNPRFDSYLLVEEPRG